MNLKWTELGSKIWATITHDHELKISKNMSQIHELNWTELKWSPISFIFSHLCRGPTVCIQNCGIGGTVVSRYLDMILCWLMNDLGGSILLTRLIFRLGSAIDLISIHDMAVECSKKCSLCAYAVLPTSSSVSPPSSRRVFVAQM